MVVLAATVAAVAAVAVFLGAISDIRLLRVQLRPGVPRPQAAPPPVFCGRSPSVLQDHAGNVSIQSEGSNYDQVIEDVMKKVAVELREICKLEDYDTAGKAIIYHCETREVPGQRGEYGCSNCVDTGNGRIRDKRCSFNRQSMSPSLDEIRQSIGVERTRRGWRAVLETRVNLQCQCDIRCVVRQDIDRDEQQEYRNSCDAGVKKTLTVGPVNGASTARLTSDEYRTTRGENEARRRAALAARRDAQLQLLQACRDSVELSCEGWQKDKWDLLCVSNGSMAVNPQDSQCSTESNDDVICADVAYETKDQGWEMSAKVTGCTMACIAARPCRLIKTTPTPEQAQTGSNTSTTARSTASSRPTPTAASTSSLCALFSRYGLKYPGCG